MESARPSEAGPIEPRGFWRQHGVKLGVSLIIAGAFAWTLHRGGIPLVPPPEAFARVSVSGVVAYTLLMMTMHTLRATRWRYLLAPIAEVPFRRVVTVAFIGFAAILLMPLRAGEFVRPYMIRGKSKLSMAAATGTIGAERIIDGLYLTVLLGICMQLAHPLSPLPDHIGKLPIPVAAVPFYAYVSLLGFFGAFTLMGIFYWRPQVGYHVVNGTLGIVSKPLAAKVGHFVATTADGLKFLPSIKHFGPFLLETTIYWAINALSVLVLARSCGITSIDYVQACVVMGVLGIGILVPAGPGLFGAFQASTYAGLAMYFTDDVVLGPGSAFVFLLYGLQVVFTLVASGVSLVVERVAAREVVEAETA